MWWLWIVVAMVLIAGPIFWARPTPRERRLAALRTDAMALGLKLSTEYVDGWTKQRLNRSQVQVYRLVCPTGSRTFRLWRFPGRIDWTPTPDTPGRMGRDGVLGVTVNTVSPGYIMTSMVAAIGEEILAKIASSIPVGRLGNPDEIAYAVSFLASDRAGFVTGSNLAINGGQHMF